MSLRRSTRLVVANKIATPTDTSRIVNTTSTTSSTRKRKVEHKLDGQPAKKLQSSSKQAKAAEPEASPFKKPDTPGAPARAERASKPLKAPPLTPTPSLVNLIKAPYSSGDIDDATPSASPQDRPADPHITNATLVTPCGTQATAFPSLNGQTHTDPSVPEQSPTKAPVTTTTLLQKACNHLIKTDPRFAAVIEKWPCPIFSRGGLSEKINPFRSLVSGICGQQVSGAAAKAIKNKFVALFNEGNDGTHTWPTPKQVTDTSIEKLRTAGLSQRKAEYVRGLAEKFVSGELSTTMLLNATDEEVMEQLIAVRGLGKWSVEMFACFGLKRMDILSTGDLGVQRGMAAWYGKDVAKLKSKGGGNKWKYMSEADMLEKSEPYKPYRSLFMWYMWRVEDVDTAVLEQ